MGDQDWTTVVFKKNKKKPQSDSRKPEQQVAQARQQGETVETFKKQTASQNKQKQPVSDARKIEAMDEADDALTHAQLNRDVCLRIQQGRASKNWTQKDLAMKPSVVNDYENGHAIPSPQVLAKMEKVLGVKLRGKV